jgi:hypothetical protein
MSLCVCVCAYLYISYICLLTPNNTFMYSMLLNLMYSVTHIHYSFWITQTIFGSNAIDTRHWLQYWYFVMDFMFLHFQGVIWEFLFIFQWYGNRCKYPEFIIGLESNIVLLSEIVCVCVFNVLLFSQLSMLSFLASLLHESDLFFRFLHSALIFLMFLSSSALT